MHSPTLTGVFIGRGEGTSMGERGGIPQAESGGSKQGTAREGTKEGEGGGTTHGEELGLSLVGRGDSCVPYYVRCMIELTRLSRSVLRHGRLDSGKQSKTGVDIHVPHLGMWELIPDNRGHILPGQNRNIKDT